MSQNQNISKEYLVEDLLNQLLTHLKKAVPSIDDNLKDELRAFLMQPIMESEFYKTISSDLRGGLSNIYKEITGVTKAGQSENAGSVPEKQEATKLFSEASDQLDEILQSTESATIQIMELVEKNLDLQTEVTNTLTTIKEKHPESKEMTMLINANEQINNDLISIMTTLSFQDLTGQRVKKIIEALRKVEGIVFELYMSTGLSMKAYDQNPKKELNEIRQEAEQKVSELKGPQSDSSQTDVDDLLAQLGL